MAFLIHIFTQAATWYALTVWAMGSVLALYAFDLKRQSARLRRDGVDGLGHVRDVRRTVRRIYYQNGIHFRVPICLVKLSYDDGRGKTRQVEWEVSLEKGETLRAGSTILLRYLPAAPGVMEVEPGRYAQEAVPAYALAAVFFATGLLLAVTRISWTLV